MGKLFNKIFKRGNLRKESEVPKTETPDEYSGTIFAEAEESVIVDPSKIEELYVKSVWLKKWIKALVDECLKFPLVAKPITDTSEAKEHAKEVNKLLRKCNKRETLYDIRSKYLKDFFLYGNGFIEISPQQKPDQKPDAIYAAPGYALKLNVDDKGNIKSEERAYAVLNPLDLFSQPVGYLPLDSVIHFVYDAMSDKVYGISPIKAIIYELTTDIGSTKALQKGAIPAGILTLKKASTDFVRSTLNKIQNMVRSEKQIKIAGVNVEADFKKFVDCSPKTEVEVQKWIGTKANVYNIPSIKLGAAEGGTFGSREVRDDFLSMIETIVKYEASKLTLGLIMNRFKYDDIIITSPFFATRLDYQRAMIATRLVNSGIVTPNEARTQYLDLPKSTEEAADHLLPADQNRRVVSQQPEKKKKISP